MTSDIPVAFPLCPARFFGKGVMKSTVSDRICNPLRNLSANPPRALKCLRFLRIGRKPENVFPTGFPTFAFRPRSVHRGR